MAGYFQYFPTVDRNGYKLSNITKRTKFLDSILDKPFVFLPYTVDSDMLPEDVAYHYYGTVEYTWLVYMANNIIDPYEDWVKSDAVFRQYFIDKYTILGEREGHEVLDWGANTQITGNIAHYVNENALPYYTENYENTDLKISAETFDYLVANPGEDTNFLASDWRPIRMLEHERNMNEEKRLIYLIDKSYAPQAKREFRRLMNE